MKKLSKKILITTLLFALCLITISTVNATTHDINNTTNLKDFITDTAQNNDIINLGEGTYNYSHINNTNGITINKNLTIIGKGSDKTIINAQKMGRIFNITNGGILTIINLTLINGNTLTYGGAIYNNGTLTITDCTFNNNNATNGGAINNHQAKDTTISNTIFNNNTAFNAGGTINNHQGTNFKIINSIFNNNIANNNGGAINNNANNTNITNSTFNNNTASFGAAIHQIGNNSIIINSTFYNNHATYGVIEQYGYNIKIIGCTFENNSVSMGGGAINNNGNNLSISNCTFINNKAPMGGAIRHEGSENMTIIGCDFINNENTIVIATNRNNTVINYNRFLNNTGYDVNNSGNNTNVDFNWWGSNNPDMSKIIGNVILNNYYTMYINGSGSDWTAGDSLNLIYSFVLNSTQNNASADLLPYFSTVFYYNGNEVNVIDARTSQTVLIPLTTAKLDSNITAFTDNEQDTILFNVSKGETSLIVVDGSTETNKAIDLTAKITDKNGNPLSGKTVKFYVNGVYVGNATTNINGIATYTYTPISSGNYTINASFEEDNDYLNSSKISNLEVSKGETILIVDDATTEFLIPVNLTAKLTNNGNPLNGKVVKFYVNGEYIGEAVSDIHGVAILSYTPTEAGIYTVNVIFEEDNDYLNSSFESLLTVTTPEPPIPPIPPTPTPDPVDPTPTPNNNKTSNNPTASAVMKETGIPINLILLAFCSVLAVLIGRKQN